MEIPYQQVHMHIQLNEKQNPIDIAHLLLIEIKDSEAEPEVVSIASLLEFRKVMAAAKEARKTKTRTMALSFLIQMPKGRRLIPMISQNGRSISLPFSLQQQA